MYGTWQRSGEVKRLIAGRLLNLTLMLGRLPTASRDFKWPKRAHYTSYATQADLFEFIARSSISRVATTPRWATSR